MPAKQNLFIYLDSFVTQEMFGRKTSSWKVLVSHLKKNVQSKPDTGDGDMFATILESNEIKEPRSVIVYVDSCEMFFVLLPGVYLHLANTLTPTELEQVLDKETEESTKFHSICKRVELANTYANMVITVSSEYLKPN
jgi:hypothetical protein